MNPGLLHSKDMGERSAMDEVSQGRIAELERALEAIRRKDRILTESQSTLGRVLASVPVIIYVYDLLERKNVYINRDMTDFLGYSAEQIQAMGSDVLATLIHAEDLPVAVQHHARLLHAEPGVALQTKYRMKTVTGGWRWFLSSDVPFEKEIGSPTRFILGCAQVLPD
ncbi:MAG: PAS domain-containing protein [Leptospirales bacterium]|nr:PAS domain-containing protein [Leptospirales bacterium]